MTDIVDTIADALLADHMELMAENKRLRDELDALRSQEPVAWATYPPTGCVTQSPAEAARWEHKGWDVVPLYAAPKQTSVPEKLPVDGTYGIYHHYAEGWNDCIDAMTPKLGELT